MEKKNIFNDEFNSGQLEEQKLRIEKLKIDLVNEEKKTGNLELESKKLKHETSDLRRFFNSVFLPILQLGASAFLIFVTWRIGFNKNDNDRKQLDAQIQQRTAQIQKNIADSETVAIRNQGLLYQIQNNSENYRLTKISDSLLNKKLAITLENSRLQNIQNSLLAERNNLAAKIRTLQNENSEATFQINESNQELQNLVRQKDKIDEELKFSIFKYALEESRKYADLNYWFSDTLISEIAKKTRFSNRIIDTLLELTKNHSFGFFGYGVSIIYFGTKNEDYKKTLFQSIENLIPSGDSVFRNYIPLWNVVSNRRWSQDDRMSFAKIILTNINKTSEPQFKTLLLANIAWLQNNYNDLNLWNNQPDLYLDYLKVVKRLYLKYDSIQYINKELSNCFQIMCPQYYVAKKFTYIFEIMTVLGRNFQTDDLDDFNKKNTFVNQSSYSTFSKETYLRLDSLQSIDGLTSFYPENKNSFIKFLQRFMVSHKNKFDFWLTNNFENTSGNQLLICHKMKSISW